MGVIDDAIEFYGEDNQVNKFLEEISELQEVTLKFRAGRDTAKHVAEEMADVWIMMFQMQKILGIPDYLINDWIMIKLERLEQRIKDGSAKE